MLCPGRIPVAEAGPGLTRDNTTNLVSSVKTFLTDEILDDLEASLSAERLGTYLAVTVGDRAGAVGLHAWNTAIGAAFHGPLQVLEVTLRNA